MFLMYLRLSRWRNSASNDPEAFNSRFNRAIQDRPETKWRSPQIQQQQAQLRQIQATYYLERRLFL